MRINTVYEFRPIIKQTMKDILRYADGKWIEDDGEYDLAFAYLEGGFPMVVYVEVPYRKHHVWSWCKDMNWRAYVQKHPNGNAWHYETDNGRDIFEDGKWDRYKHPNDIASREGMNMMANKHRCSNGHAIEFNPDNEYIVAGLLRDIETKEIIKRPEKINCIYCGEIILPEITKYMSKK